MTKNEVSAHFVNFDADDHDPKQQAEIHFAQSDNAATLLHQEASTLHACGSPEPARQCIFGKHLKTSELHDNADQLAFVHQREAMVDVFQLELVGNHWVNLNLAVNAPVDDLGNVGLATCAAKGRAMPDAACHKLEGEGGDLGASFALGDKGTEVAQSAGELDDTFWSMRNESLLQALFGHSFGADSGGSTLGLQFSTCLGSIFASLGSTWSPSMWDSMTFMTALNQ